MKFPDSVVEALMQAWYGNRVVREKLSKADVEDVRDHLRTDLSTFWNALVAAKGLPVVCDECRHQTQHMARCGYSNEGCKERHNGDHCKLPCPDCGPACDPPLSPGTRWPE
jgi:hypothetical protein